MTFFIILTIAFAGLNLVPAAAGYAAARHFLSGFAERITGAILIWFMIITLSFGLAGCFGCLRAEWCFLFSILISAPLLVLARKKKGKKTELPEFSLEEKILFLLAFGICLIRLFNAAFLHGGTDTFLYHLYFPASWLTEGKIYPVPTPRLFCEYYPMYGELIYGWFLLPWNDSSFALFPQTLSTIMAAFSMYAFGVSNGFRRSASLASVCLMLFPGVVGENAVMGYTDVMTGSFLLTGICFLLTGAVRKNSVCGLLSGIAFGMSAGIKFSGLILAPFAALGLYLLILSCRKKRWNVVFPSAAAAVLTAVPAYLPTFLRTGNPFYPVRIPFLFPNGMEFSRESIGLGTETLSYFAGGGCWDVSWIVMVVFTVLPFFVIFLWLSRKFYSGHNLLGWTACLFLLLLLFQLNLYPAMTQPRQIIPFLMSSSVLFLPVCDYCRRKSGRYFFPVAVLLCFLFLHIPYYIKWIQMASVLIVFCSAALLPRKWFLRILAAVGICCICGLPFVFHSRLSHRDYYRELTAGKVLAQGIEVIWKEYLANWKPVTVVNVNGWQNYMFMEDMPGNRVITVPLNRKNKIHPHDFLSLEEMEAAPVSKEEWLVRLKKTEADYFYCEIYPHEKKIRTELKYALDSPDIFQPVIFDQRQFLFRLRKQTGVP